MLKRFREAQTWGEAEPAIGASKTGAPSHGNGTSPAPFRKENTMNPLAWIEPAFAAEGFDIPLELRTMLSRGVQDQESFYFSNADEGIEDTERMNHMFPAHRVIAFGRRLDYDGVVCLVLAAGAYPRGSTLILHWDGWPGSEVDAEFPSLAAWAKSAEVEIEERIRMGWNEPIKDLLD